MQAVYQVPYFIFLSQFKFYNLFKEIFCRFCFLLTEPNMNLLSVSGCVDDSHRHRFGHRIGVTVVSVVILICWVATFHTETPLPLFYVPCCEAARILANTAVFPREVSSVNVNGALIKSHQDPAVLIFFPSNYIY